MLWFLFALFLLAVVLALGLAFETLPIMLSISLRLLGFLGVVALRFPLIPSPDIQSQGVLQPSLFRER